LNGLIIATFFLGNGLFSPWLRKSSGLVVRRSAATPPPNLSTALPVQKNPRFYPNLLLELLKIPSCADEASFEIALINRCHADIFAASRRVDKPAVADVDSDVVDTLL
jgi:hypothetical protein